MKTPPEAEKPKRGSSSGSQKGTKRKKNVEDDEGEGSGSQRGTKSKKHTEDDGPKTDEVEGPKDVHMEDGTKHTESKEDASSEVIHSLAVEKSANQTNENVKEEVEQDVEQSEGKETELESRTEAKKNQNGTEIFPPASDSEKVVLNEKEVEDSVSEKDEASVRDKVAEILSENGEAKDEQLNVAPKDNSELGKEIQESPNDAEKDDEALIYKKDAEDEKVNITSPKINLELAQEVKEDLNDTEVSLPASDPEKVSLTGKDDEVSATAKDEASVSIKGAETLSENGGGKTDEVNAAPVENFSQKCDEGKSNFESFPANW